MPLAASQSGVLLLSTFLSSPLLRPRSGCGFGGKRQVSSSWGRIPDEHFSPSFSAQCVFLRHYEDPNSMLCNVDVPGEFEIEFIL